jgi:probable rRNA maturation factor
VEVTVEIAVEAGAWPPDQEVRRICEDAIRSAVSVLGKNAWLAGASSRVAGKGAGGPLAAAEVSVVLTDDASIRRLNREFRGIDKPTNVLSFPQAPGPLLGDIVLAAETVAREAALAKKPLEAHITHLVMHGFFHLLGLDHDTEAEAEAMEALERAALQRMGIADPYRAPQEP